MRSGVIVAGGYSTRFGERDKAVAELAGVAMIRRVADRLAETVDELVVNCRPEQRDEIATAMDGYPLDVTFALDDDPDRGPVAGIRNGLAAAGGTYAVVLACDMPFVDPALVSYLFEGAAGADAAVPKLDGWYQPTQAVYRVTPMVDACDRALRSENPRIVEPIEMLSDVVVVEEADIEAVASTGSFDNINTAEELAAAADRLG